MAPSKSRAAADDSHSASGHGMGSSAAANNLLSIGGPPTNGAGAHSSAQHTTTNGKARRTAASAVIPSHPPPAAPVPTQSQIPNLSHNHSSNQSAGQVPAPTLQWNDFERGVLHGYTRAFQLDEAGAFASEFAQWILSQPGSVGLQSPTMQRRQDMRRQSKTRLASAVRKHFNGQGGQENDIVVDFLHKIQTHEVVRQRRPRRMGSNAREVDG
ncbi:hypothetical protein SEPCBS119000_002158 [Sporothrix epigloea]|uniref:Histone deacetylase complex subunit SAP30 Sin3 binding domain-containing protein n=1 Tax=Sporothrix epigloea TaxID=1892477 RepID=A0ABP0DEQ2_9PEZI